MYETDIIIEKLEMISKNLGVLEIFFYAGSLFFAFKLWLKCGEKMTIWTRESYYVKTCVHSLSQGCQRGENVWELTNWPAFFEPLHWHHWQMSYLIKQKYMLNMSGLSNAFQRDHKP